MEFPVGPGCQTKVFVWIHISGQIIQIRSLLKQYGDPFHESSETGFRTSTSYSFKKGEETLSFDFLITSSGVILRSRRKSSTTWKLNHLGKSGENVIQFGGDLNWDVKKRLLRDRYFLAELIPRNLSNISQNLSKNSPESS